MDYIELAKETIAPALRDHAYTRNGRCECGWQVNYPLQNHGTEYSQHLSHVALKIAWRVLQAGTAED